MIYPSCLASGNNGVQYCCTEVCYFVQNVRFGRISHTAPAPRSQGVGVCELSASHATSQNVTTLSSLSSCEHRSAAERTRCLWPRCIPPFRRMGRHPSLSCRAPPTCNPNYTAGVGWVCRESGGAAFLLSLCAHSCSSLYAASCRPDRRGAEEPYQQRGNHVAVWYTCTICRSSKWGHVIILGNPVLACLLPRHAIATNSCLARRLCTYRYDNTRHTCEGERERERARWRTHTHTPETAMLMRQVLLQQFNKRGTICTVAYFEVHL